MFILLVCDAKVRTIFYIASDLSKSLRLFNDKSCATLLHFSFQTDSSSCYTDKRRQRQTNYATR